MTGNMRNSWRRDATTVALAYEHAVREFVISDEVHQMIAREVNRALDRRLIIHDHDLAEEQLAKFRKLANRQIDGLTTHFKIALAEKAEHQAHKLDAQVKCQRLIERSVA